MMFVFWLHEWALFVEERHEAWCIGSLFLGDSKEQCKEQCVNGTR